LRNRLKVKKRDYAFQDGARLAHHKRIGMVIPLPFTGAIFEVIMAHYVHVIQKKPLEVL
jgi:hypothetical protein